MSFTRRSFLKGLAACPLCAQAAMADSSVHWTYEGHGGPGEWGQLAGDFKTCQVGSQQSPIDLDSSVATELHPVVPAWKPQMFKVINNGHTIQADAPAVASSLTLGDTRYELRQFHFHAPSEHALGGQRTAMEAHFVHAAPTGGLAVIGVFMTAGKKNDAFATVMAAAPKAEGATMLKDAMDISAFLPADRSLYRYEGSLTTPPCSEVVDWNVFAKSIEVAQADIDTFRAIFPMNARPLQAVNRRFILRLN
ncbi:MAG: carbonic anhydrase family protein [Pseudomonadota bacterium]